MTQNISSQLKKLMTQACTLVINLSDSTAQYRYTDRFYRVNHKACNRFERRANAFRAYLDSQDLINKVYWDSQDLLNSAQLASSPPEVVDSPTQAEPQHRKMPLPELVPCGGSIDWECEGYIDLLEESPYLPDGVEW